ncbi:MAG: hypothetical protein B7Y62_04025 [Sphingomonadales bacterium 35-56-22]|jgi:hypothetical protein|uniref:hypothetical protein n=1 Tax=Sphingorhabdus sp. TaxID=1902408 RepID=UPI000BD53B4D|nr:hypothetical protein [Sphingorhabdus sp.]OYY16308.1 MAG: hypothetical protein B7Y62_04025 [Sphingomonadales bacterium 35-56-22]OYY98658.1 MAG: hypothetical protein B7Y38_02015 [Sphingomonadales bacterium 28-56-43]OYZ61720.1 MAG: hypothetical protein B7Y10_00245 [Sphingomonadales bacterium 24-56-14]OZA83935.1 MAG: hypothetical protein B7X66_02170 [Sphingomonadales bacterium 39-57-19]HQS11586.1 hypothetical protein [Sphingorhabdus sp.]
MSKIGDSIKTAADSAKDSLATAKAKTTPSTAAARAKASEAYEKGKGKTSDGIDKNPLAIVLGGIAIGAIVGALLPRTERETKVLGKAGKKLNKKARKMADAAKAAGKDQVESLGLNGDALRLQFRDLVSKAALAVKAASQAATDAAKEK